MNGRTALYRHFNATGDLLYVGISLSAVQRLGQHMEKAKWAEKIAKVTVEWHESRADAERAEREAIKREKPAHNVMHVDSKAKAGPKVERDLTNTMIVWTPQWMEGEPTRGRMALVQWPDAIRASNAFTCSAGACDLHVSDALFEQRRLWLMCQLVTIMVSDRIDPQTVHQACLPLPEYRASLPIDAFTKQERAKYDITGEWL